MEEKLEARKGDLENWVQEVPDGPRQLSEKVPDLMKRILREEQDYHEEALAGLGDHLANVKALRDGSARKHMLILMGGGGGSLPLERRTRNWLSEQGRSTKTTLVLTLDLRYR